jgi:hypothetical protein
MAADFVPSSNAKEAVVADPDQPVIGSRRGWEASSKVFMVIGEYPSPLPHLTCDQDPRHASAWALDGDWTVWTRGSIVPRGLGGPDAEAVMSPPVG